MKKLSMLFLAVIITATLSAFSAKQSGIVYYQDETGFHVKVDNEGTCEENKDFACEYTWSGGGTSDPNDPDNYDVVPGQEGLVYRP